MAVKDILLPLLSFPRATKPEAIEKCAFVGAHLKARVTAVAFEFDLLPAPGPFAGAFAVGLPDSAPIKEAQISRQNAEQALKRFESAAQASASASEALLHTRYRRRRRSALGSASSPEGHRPPSNQASSSGKLPDSFNHVAIAWDHSAQAARAVADALPLLKVAKSVRIFTMIEDEAEAEARLNSVKALAKHLSEHRIETGVELLNAKPDRNALETYVQVPSNRTPGDGRLSTFAPPRVRNGWRDVRRPRAPSLLGDDVALRSPSVGGMPEPLRNSVRKPGAQAHPA